MTIVAKPITLPEQQVSHGFSGLLRELQRVTRWHDSILLEGIIRRYAETAVEDAEFCKTGAPACVNNSHAQQVYR